MREANLKALGKNKSEPIDSIHNAKFCIVGDIMLKRLFSRRSFLKRSGLAAAATAARPFSAFAQRHGDVLVDQPSLVFLRELTMATIESARFLPGHRQNATGIALITPGGNYPALWTRDFAMSLDCGLIKPAEILPQLRLIAKCQNGAQERRLSSGGIIPPFAIADHVNLAGGAVFYPGTYSSGEDQGSPPWGPLPPIDDHFYFVHIAYALWRDTGNSSFLDETIGDYRLLERLERAFHSPASDPETGAAACSKARRAVGFGFQDSVYLLGSMSFATLLRYRAARQLATLCRAKGKSQASSNYTQVAEKIAGNFERVFCSPSKLDGWLLAATEVGQQADVWATLFALNLGVLGGASSERARKTIAAAVKGPGNTVEYQGGVRHVPSDRYFRPNQCWEGGGGTVNTYQSGAFWHTPTGWLIEALRTSDPDLSRDVWNRYISHLQDGDFRKGAGGHAPWECFGLEMAGAQNPVYFTSVSLPLAVVQAM